MAAAPRVNPSRTSKKETTVTKVGEAEPFVLSEIIIGVLYTFTTDLICLGLDWVAIGELVSPVIRNGVAWTIWAWFRAKKDPNTTKAGRLIFKGFANVVPLIPLFINTVMFIAEVYIHNNPEKFAAVEKVAGATAGKV